MTGPGDRKRAARVDVRYNAVLTEPDGCRVNVVIVDLSGQGFRLQSEAELVSGEEVTIRAGKAAPVRARIQWARGLEAGGIFLEPAKL